MLLVTPVSVAQRLFVALDCPGATEALALAEKLAPLGVRFKVGLQLFYAEGVSLIRRLQRDDVSDRDGLPVFVDLKLHDIPNTVAGAVDSLVRQGVCLLNVHAQGGPEMMRVAAESARQARETTGGPVVQVLGVSLLTSLSERHLRDFLFVAGVSVAEYVQHLAIQAKRCGLDGMVCSPNEAATIREACGPDFLLVTPGVRPGGEAVQDQSRTATPGDALRKGADCLGIGRPITSATDPVSVTRRILDEMHEALV